MSVENIPEVYQSNSQLMGDLFVYDFKMNQEIIRSKVKLSRNMFSFLRVGTKQVHFADTSVIVNKDQSLLIRKGNLLWTELLDKDNTYYCKLMFFSESILKTFLEKHGKYKELEEGDETPYFTIENDNYLSFYLDSISEIGQLDFKHQSNLLTLKFDEIMLYLLSKYGKPFEFYLRSLISEEKSSFKKIVENNVYSNLKLEEIAFLCNMSLSTFKRNFKSEFKESPGKWIQDSRLQRAKELLSSGEQKASELYLDFGYKNLSNFSIAFKNKFGVNPSEVDDI